MGVSCIHRGFGSGSLDWANLVPWFLRFWMLGLGHWGYIGDVIVFTNSLVLWFFETSPNIRMVVIDDKMSPNMLFNAWTSRRHPGAYWDVLKVPWGRVLGPPGDAWMGASCGVLETSHFVLGVS